jgi:arylsulfatase A-like enzyme
MGNDESPRPGFNRWVSFRGQGVYSDPELNVNGRYLSSHSQYGLLCIRTHRWKYIQYRDIKAVDELYDLTNDPFELNSVIGDRKAPLQQMEQRLRALLKQTDAVT